MARAVQERVAGPRAGRVEGWRQASAVGRVVGGAGVQVGHRAAAPRPGVGTTPNRARDSVDEQHSRERCAGWRWGSWSNLGLAIADGPKTSIFVPLTISSKGRLYFFRQAGESAKGTAPSAARRTVR